MKGPRGEDGEDEVKGAGPFVRSRSGTGDSSVQFQNLNFTPGVWRRGLSRAYHTLTLNFTGYCTGVLYCTNRLV